MPTNKKNTAKSTRSPAPATKEAKSRPKKKTAAQPSAGKAKPVPAPAVETAKSAPVLTTIAARIDVGFGNSLFVRGEGPGLSWDRGVAMNCVAGDHWELVLGEASRPFTFKLLVNDLTWSAGADFTVDPGASVTLTPEF